MIVYVLLKAELPTLTHSVLQLCSRRLADWGGALYGRVEGALCSLCVMCLDGAAISCVKGEICFCSLHELFWQFDLFPLSLVRMPWPHTRGHQIKFETGNALSACTCASLPEGPAHSLQNTSSNTLRQNLAGYKTIKKVLQRHLESLFHKPHWTQKTFWTSELRSELHVH